VLFPTGFAANLGVLTTLAGAGVRLCSDELQRIVDALHGAISEVCGAGG
jgi:7-keto-8-aminopelargonate synthetase-like enzyme